MKMDKLIANKYDTFPRGQQKVADLLVADPVAFSISTVAQVARNVNMSETTVIRLAYTMGFRSFSEMQRKLQEEYLKPSSDTTATEVHHYNTEETLTDMNLFHHIINQDLHMLKNIIGSMDQELTWEAINLLMSAERVKIGGCLASHSVAHWFSLKLGMMRENVSLLSNEYNSIFDSMISKTADETVYFLISMPSYVQDTIRIGRIAKEQGSKVIALTDRRLSPVGRIADICLTMSLGEQSRSVISVTPVMSYLNLIASGIEFKYENTISSRVQKITEMYSRENIVVE